MARIMSGLSDAGGVTSCLRCNDIVSLIGEVEEDQKWPVAASTATRGHDAAPMVVTLCSASPTAAHHRSAARHSSRPAPRTEDRRQFVPPGPDGSAAAHAPTVPASGGTAEFVDT